MRKLSRAAEAMAARGAQMGIDPDDRTVALARPMTAREQTSVLPTTSSKDPRKDSRVDAYLDKQELWKEHFLIFREALLATELQEAIKWGIPIYTLNGSNVLGYAGFKEHCAVWFYSGSFLQDSAGKLHNAQEGKTRFMRQWRFHGGEDVPQELFHSYVQEAIDNQKAGKVGRPEPQTTVSMIVLLPGRF